VLVLLLGVVTFDIVVIATNGTTPGSTVVYHGNSSSNVTVSPGKHTHDIHNNHSDQG